METRKFYEQPKTEVWELQSAHDLLVISPPSDYEAGSKGSEDEENEDEYGDGWWW